MSKIYSYDLVAMGKARLTEMQEHPHQYSNPEPAGWARGVCLLALSIAFLIFCLLVGCAAPETRVETRTQTNVVSVPMAVACFDPAELPAVPARTVVDAETATTDQLAAAAAADRENFMRYAKAIDAYWAQCSKQTTKGAK